MNNWFLFMATGALVMQWLMYLYIQCRRNPINASITTTKRVDVIQKFIHNDNISRLERLRRADKQSC